MARVAANQDRADEMRRRFIYAQKVRVRVLENKGRMTRDEEAVYDVTPQLSKVDKKLVELRAAWMDKKTREQYTGTGKTPEVHGVRNIIDRALAESLRDSLVNNKDSKDGISSHLFPLTSEQAERYRFTLKGKEQHRGRPAVRIAFEPRERKKDSREKSESDDDRAVWEGEALIDEEDQQPIYVWTRLARGIPMFVRVMFGTNIQQLGFALSYAKIGDHLWFLASYGGEFRLRAVFFYARTVTIGLQNSDFRLASADSRLVPTEQEP